MVEIFSYLNCAIYFVAAVLGMIAMFRSTEHKFLYILTFVSSFASMYSALLVFAFLTGVDMHTFHVDGDLMRWTVHHSLKGLVLCGFHLYTMRERNDRIS